VASVFATWIAEKLAKIQHCVQHFEHSLFDPLCIPRFEQEGMDDDPNAHGDTKGNNSEDPQFSG